MLLKKFMGSFVLLGIIVAGLTFSTTSAEARGGFFEKFFSKTFTGTVTEFRRNKLTIKTSNNKTIKITITRQTDFVGKRVRVGDDVVVNAKVRRDEIIAQTVKVKDKPRYGHDNCGNGGHGNNRGGRDEKCDNSGHNDDHDWDNGRGDGYDRGRDDGRNNRRDDDTNNDYRNGHDDNYVNGFNDGYEQGFRDGQNERGGNRR